MEWNGIIIKGMEWNGMEQNRMEWIQQGKEWNEIELFYNNITIIPLILKNIKNNQ